MRAESGYVGMGTQRVKSRRTKDGIVRQCARYETSFKPGDPGGGGRWAGMRRPSLCDAILVVA